MVSFSQEFPSDLFSLFDEKTTTEFKRAYVFVREFSPSKTTVGDCVACIDHCFSKNTLALHGRDVRHFVRDAKKELYQRARMVGTAVLTRKKRSAPQRTKKEFSPYLVSMLQRLVPPHRFLGGHEKEYCDTCLRSFDTVCDEYRDTKLGEGSTSQRGLEQEIARAKEQAHLSLEQEKEKQERFSLLIARLKELLGCDLLPRLSERVSWMTSCLLLEIETLLKECPTHEFLEERKETIKKILLYSERPFRAEEFSVFLKFHEAVQSLPLNRSEEISALADVLARFDGDSALKFIETIVVHEGTEIAGPLYEWFFKPETQHTFQQTAHSNQEAEERCKKNLSQEVYGFLLENFCTPKMIENILRSLSECAQETLKHESTPENIKLLLGSSTDFFTGRKDFPYMLEYALPLVKYLRGHNFHDEEISHVLALLKEGDPHFKQIYEEPMDPYALFSSLSPTQIRMCTKMIEIQRSSRQSLTPSAATSGTLPRQFFSFQEM